MADHAISTRVCVLFHSAWQTYEKKVGVTLVEHPLAVQLQSCHSAQSITTVLQNQVQAFSNLRGSDRVIKSIKSTVSILTKLSATTFPALDISLVRQKALMACSPALTVFTAIPTCENDIHWSRHPTCCLYRFFWCLYKYSCDVQANQAAKAITASYDSLVDLLESIENILSRLNVFTLIPFTSEMDEMLVKIMGELLSALALATRELEQGRPSESIPANVSPKTHLTDHIAVKSVRNVFGEKGVPVEAVLERLDRLTQDEARATAAETLVVIYSLIQNLAVVMDGEQRCSWLNNEHMLTIVHFFPFR